MPRGFRVLSLRANRGLAGMPLATIAVLALFAAVVVGTTSCTGAAPHDPPPPPPVPLAPGTRPPASGTSVLSGAYVFSPMIGASTLSNELASVFRSPSDRDRVYVASTSTVVPRV